MSAAASGPAETGEGATGNRAQQATAQPPHTHVPTVNIANLLTLSRLALVPLFVGALFLDGGAVTWWRSIAAVLFAVACVTDHVDGWLARRYGLITDFGKIADPIADKALIGAALIALSLLGELGWWVTCTIAVREVAVTLLRFWVIRHGVIPASRGGKAKTLAQAVAIGVYLLPLPGGAVTDATRLVLMGIALVLTVLTGFDYAVRALRLRAAGKRVTS